MSGDGPTKEVIEVGSLRWALVQGLVSLKTRLGQIKTKKDNHVKTQAEDGHTELLRLIGHVPPFRRNQPCRAL